MVAGRYGRIMAGSARDRRLRRHWDTRAVTYDRKMAGADQRFFGDTRAWLCGQATGDTLEVAIGTGLNLPHYPAGVRLTGVEWSEDMLAVARRRADPTVTLRQGDARALDFADATFDTVVCTFALCVIPEPRRAVGEMVRVLRPGGLLLLADHVASSNWLVRGLQYALDAVSVPLYGEHFSRRPIRWVREAGLTIERHERFKLGLIERLAARTAAPG
jgi:ubiquinone/menaquinone biosynthesis C-methylase UbiE